MIESVELKNYKSHRSTTVPLKKFTLIVGDNAVGKTSILNAIHLAGQALSLTAPPFTLFDGERSLTWLTRAGAEGPMEIGLSGTTPSEWTFRLISTDPKSPDDMQYSWSLGPRVSEPASLKTLTANAYARRWAPPEVKPPREVEVARSAVFLRLDARRLAEPSTSNEVRPRIEVDGAGLATALQFLKVNSLERFLALEQAAKKVIPSLTGLSFERLPQHRTFTRLLNVEGQKVPVEESESFIAEGLRLQFVDSRESLPAHAASEGTLIVLGVLGVLFHPDCPRVILLDDIDRALHPRAQAELVAVLREILKEVPDTQIVATAHSPYLADSFEPEEVVVVGRPAEGPVVARRLSEHPDQKLLKALTTGEFLSTTGQGWFGA